MTVFFGGDLNEDFGLFIDDMSQWCVNASRSLGNQTRGLQTPVGDDMVRWMEQQKMVLVTTAFPNNKLIWAPHMIVTKLER